MAYKITTNKNKSLISEWKEDGSEFGLQYEKNKWVKGEYPLFVFKRIEDAEYFLRTDYISTEHNYRIWRCQTRGGLRRIDFVSMFLNEIRRLWNKVKSSGFGEVYWSSLEMLELRGKVRPAPFGTYVVDEVKLTKIVRICEE